MAETIKPSFKSSNFWGLGKNIVTGIASGITNNKNGVSKAVGGLASHIIGVFKGDMQIHSPSKVMADLAQYIPLGIAKGIDDNVNIAYSSLKDLTKGLKQDFAINPDDFKIDTNQFIDYGEISGAIQAQSNVEVGSNISQEIKEAVKEAVREVLADAKIKGELDVKANKEGILKIVQIEAEEFEMQTGNPAFNF